MSDEIPQLKLSVGTFSGNFDDITISFHNGEKSYMAVLSPLIAKKMLEVLSNLMGKDNPDMFLIPMHEMIPDLSWENAREQYESWFWQIKEEK